MASGQFLRHYRNYLDTKNKLEQTGHINIVIYTGSAILRHDNNLIGHYHRCLEFLQSEPRVTATGHLPFESADKQTLFESFLPPNFWNSVKRFFCINNI